MTLIAAIIFGIATGWFVSSTRRRLWITTVAVLLVLMIQSSVLPLTKKANFSLSDPGYWAVQPFILLLGLLLAIGVGRLRGRRAKVAASL